MTILFIFGGLLTVKTLFWSRDKEAFAAPTLFQKIKQGITQTAVLLVVLFAAGILYHALAPVRGRLKISEWSIFMIALYTLFVEAG